MEWDLKQWELFEAIALDILLISPLLAQNVQKDSSVMQIFGSTWMFTVIQNIYAICAVPHSVRSDHWTNTEVNIPIDFLKI